MYQWISKFWCLKYRIGSFTNHISIVSENYRIQKNTSHSSSIALSSDNTRVALCRQWYPTNIFNLSTEFLSLFHCSIGSMKTHISSSNGTVDFIYYNNKTTTQPTLCVAYVIVYLIEEFRSKCLIKTKILCKWNAISLVSFNWKKNEIKEKTHYVDGSITL